MTDGWVKLKDPKTGKDFYANKITRETQWEAPPGFVHDTPVPVSHGANFGASASYETSSNTHNVYNSNGSNGGDDHLHLPANWERMHDEASGKYFYVDHVNKVTTWEHPGKSASARSHAEPVKTMSMNTGTTHNTNDGNGGMATGFGFIPASSPSSTAAAATSASSTVRSLPKKKAFSPAKSWGMSQPPPSANANGHAKSVTERMMDYKFTSFTNTSVDDDKSTKYYNGKNGYFEQVDFKVQKVPDILRSKCAIASCKTVFTMTERRHHCRLCGDIFCDACSSHKVLLPLGGKEFEKPVRICDECYVDVENGNFFSMRRYLTPLLLYNGDNADELQMAYASRSSTRSIGSSSDHGTAGNIGVDNVKGALTSLYQDLDSILLDSSSFSEKMNIPADILVPAITRHLTSDDTSDRAIRALSSLLSLGNVVGDDSFVMAVYMQDGKGGKETLENIFRLLEWSGESVKTLAVQEQASKALFYLTDHKVFSNILSKEEIEGRWSEDGSAINYCDLHRALRSTLDHTTCSASPSLQRWSAACIRNMIAEDHRRACDAVSDAMTMGVSELSYESFMHDFVSSGGAMILASLVASDDADTRAHAMAALSGTIYTSRELNVRLGVFKEAYQLHNIQVCSEVSIVEAIVSSGACGSSLAQLLLSGDNSAAAMACDFAKTLVQPILTDPNGSSVPRYHRLGIVKSGASVQDSDQTLGVYRKAALEIGASDGVLSALIQLIPEWGGSSRPIELRCSAMYALAAIALTLSFWDSKLKNSGASLSPDDTVLQLQDKIISTISLMEEERMGELVLEVFSSGSVISSLNTSRDSPSSQIKEAAALIICALSSCSEHFADLFISSNTIASLISISSDDGYTNASSRGAWAPRHLSSLEAIASILVGGWKAIQKESIDERSKVESYQSSHNRQQSESSKSLALLLEALDAGIVPLISRFLSMEQEFNDSESAYASARVKIATCHIVAAIFGIGRSDTTNIGFSRIFEAMGNRHRIIPLIIYLLGSVAPAMQTFAGQGTRVDKMIPIAQLLEATLLAAGNVCGSDFCSFGMIGQSDGYVMNDIFSVEKDIFSCQFEDVCTSACDVVSKNNFLAPALVGAYGEGIVMPTLRLLSTIAANASSKKIHKQIVRSGALLPVTDILRDAMVAGDYYFFDASVIIISKTGPHMTASSETNSIHALRECIKLLANVLTIEDKRNASASKKLAALKKRCITAINLLSTNSSLWTSIVTYFVPSFSQHWITENSFCDIDGETSELVCAGLEAINRVISLPAHAVSVASSGIAASLSSMITTSSDGTNPKLEQSAIQILHTLLTHSCQGTGKDKIEAGIVDVYALDASCSILSRDPDSDMTTAISNAKLGLEIIQMTLSGLWQVEHSQLHQSPRIIAFVETVLANPEFVKRICSTLLCDDFMNSNKSSGGEHFTSVKNLYGSPILLFEGRCGSFARSVDVTLHFLFWVAFYSSLVQSQNSEVLWDTLMMQDEDTPDECQRCMTMIAASANFLNLLSNEEHSVCMPPDRSNHEMYRVVALPVVRERLLYVLTTGTSGYLAACDRDDDSLSSFHNLLKHNCVPQMCLGLTTNPVLLESAYQALETSLNGFPEVLMSSLVSEKTSLEALFHLLGSSDQSQKGKMNVFAAAVMSSAGNLGILGDAVTRFGLRSIAVASLSAACLMEDQQSEVCLLAEDMTEEGSSLSMLCLHGLVDVLSVEQNTKGEKKLVVSPSEARAIASSLGKKLSAMVLERFLHKAEQERHCINESGHQQVKNFPEVTMLCALAASKEALSFLVASGGLEALSLVAAEGVIEAIAALQEVCHVDASAVIEVDGHVSALHVIAEQTNQHDAERSCFELLASICKKSKDGRAAVCEAEECMPCIGYASDRVKGLLSSVSDDKDAVVSPSDTKGTEMAAMSFLASLLQSEECRAVILEDGDLKTCLDNIVLNAPNYPMQLSGVGFLCKCARFVGTFTSEVPYNVDNITSPLISILESSRSRSKRLPMGSSTGFTSFGDFSESHHLNENLLVANACRGLESLIQFMPKDSIDKTLTALASLWCDTIDFQSTGTKKTASKTNNSGLLMYNISCIFLGVCGNNDINVFPTVVSNILKLILTNSTLTEKRLKQAASDTTVNDDNLYWIATHTQCLQCLATLTIDPTYQASKECTLGDVITKAESEVVTSTRARKPARLLQSPATPPPTLRSILEQISVNISDQTNAVIARKILENLSYF